MVGEERMTHHSSATRSVKTSTGLALISVDELLQHAQDILNRIARRAFEIFESRGGVHGHDWEDWFLAESELLTPVKLLISESGEWVTISAQVPGFNTNEIKVSVDSRRLIISGKAGPRESRKSGKHLASLGPMQLIFQVLDLAAEVDPSKTKATFNDGRLNVVMAKVAPTMSVSAGTRPGLSSEGGASDHKTGGMEAAGIPPVIARANESVVEAQAVSLNKVASVR
jgi:HSP20 family molecular chaperone IbpA